MYCYALVEKNNICTGFLCIDKPYLEIPEGHIYLGEGDTSIYEKFRNMKYNINTDTWEEIEISHPKPEPKPLSEQEQAILDTAINTDYLVCLADLGI